MTMQTAEGCTCNLCSGINLFITQYIPLHWIGSMLLKVCRYGEGVCVVVVVAMREWHRCASLQSDCLYRS